MLEVITYQSIKTPDNGQLCPLNRCVMKQAQAQTIAKYMSTVLATSGAERKKAMQLYSTVKSRLAAFTPSSTATSRNIADAVYSGVMVFDNDEPKHLCKSVAECQRQATSWLDGCKRLGAIYGGLSASGCGAYAAFYVPQATKETYTGVYELLAAYLQDVLETPLDTTKDISRARFFGQTMEIWCDDLKDARPLDLPEGQRHTLLMKYTKSLQCRGSNAGTVKAAAQSVLGPCKEVDDIIEYTSSHLYLDADKAASAAWKEGVRYALLESKPTTLVNCNTGVETSGGWSKSKVNDCGHEYLIKGAKKANPLTFSEYITALPLTVTTITKQCVPYAPQGFYSKDGKQYWNTRPEYKLEQALATCAKPNSEERNYAAALVTFMRYQLGVYAPFYARWVIEHIGSALVGKEPHVAGSAWIFIGRGGTGKSTIARLSEVLLGHMRHAKESEPIGRFTAGLGESLFFDWPETPDVVSKDIITSQFITLEHKGKDIEQVPNCSAQIYTTNFYKCAAQIAQDSGLHRRYIVVDVDNDCVRSLGWATYAKCQAGEASDCTDSPAWLSYYHRAANRQSLGYIHELWQQLKVLAREISPDTRPPLTGLTSALLKDLSNRTTNLGIVYQYMKEHGAAHVEELLEQIKAKNSRCGLSTIGLETALTLLPSIFTRLSPSGAWQLKEATTDTSDLCLPF